MKVVQTFWSGKGTPLQDSYGWLEPQHHLMSWALSCLSLRENYDEVVMYTDSVGKAIFGDILKLPYTDIIVQYDNLSCPIHQWAYPKMLTYSLQEKPFIHVDGDVYLPKRLDAKVEEGGLIAQNREIGTEYYRRMMDAIEGRGIIIPPFLKKALEQESIPSYNAGVLGGNDIDFIQKYCKKAFDFINSNDSLNINQEGDINHNILFEQILFYAIAEKHKKDVTTVLDHSINDNGYSYPEFCDFYTYNNTTLMHIIGGHKKYPKTCELLGRTLLNKYPEYYKRIIELFPENHVRLQTKKKKTQIVPPLTTQMNIASYKDFLSDLSIKWNDISNDCLLNLESQSANYFEFINNSKDDKLPMIIKNNPYLSIYEIGNNWTIEAKQLIGEKIDKHYSDYSDIGCIPQLLNDGLKEVLIDDLDYNILSLAKTEKTFENLLDQLNSCFRGKMKKELIYQKVIAKLEYLLFNKLIYIDTIKKN